MTFFEPNDLAHALQLVTGLAIGLTLVPASFAAVHTIEKWIGSAQRRAEEQLAVLARPRL
jgi:hypothetical protein